MNPDAIRALSNALDGEVITPDDENYDEARSIFNAPGISFIIRGTLNMPTDPGTIQISFSRPPSSIDLVKMFV